MAKASLGRKREIAISLTADESQLLRALADSARSYPGRKRSFPLSPQLIEGHFDRFYNAIEFVAADEYKTDFLADYQDDSLLFGLSTQAGRLLDELLITIEAGAWDLSWRFPAAGELKYEKGVLFLIL